MQEKAKRYILITVGCAVFSLSVIWIAGRSGIVNGGFSGISIIINKLSKNIFGYGVPLFLTNLLLNIPLFIISARQRGFKFVSRSFFALILSSLFMFLFEGVTPPFDISGDNFLSSLMSGVLSGAGLGIVLSTFTTTGGTDMLAAALKRRFSQLSIAVIILVCDGLIVLSGVFVFGLSKAVYGLLSLIISSKVIDLFLSGFTFSKAVFIISDKSEEISKQVMKTARRGNTLIEATGMYTKKRRDILFVVVASKEIAQIKEIVKNTDKNAFMAVCSASEVLGEGFAHLNKSGDPF